MPTDRPQQEPRHRDNGASIDLYDVGWTPLGRRRPVIDHVDLHIGAGERVLLVGPSGAGKSTLLRAVAGVLDAVETGTLTGKVLVDGSPACAGDGRVGLLVQDPADARVAGTIGRDIAYGPENLGLPRPQIHQRVSEALEAVGLPYGTNHATTALSGGEAQRLALAGILALDPRVMLLDEPTSMLDEHSARAVHAAVDRTARRSGATLVVVEHRLDGWTDLVDRVVVLGVDGQVVADGTPEQVLTGRGDELTAAGIWVPGAPPPAPMDLPDELVGPWPDTGRHDWAAAATTPLILARDLRMIRRPPRGLRIIRKDDASVPALDGVDAQATSGRLTALRGPSGSGKSTLLGVLLGLYPATGGQVTAAETLAAGAGTDPARWPSRDLARRVGWVPQRAELTITSHQSVRDCLLTTPRALGRLDGADRDRAHRRIDGLLEVLGLLRAAARSPHRLSGGELRRLAVAGALAHGPVLLGADEPTVGQDRITWSAVVGAFTSARRAGCGVLVATHDQLLVSHSDDVIRLERGRRVDSPAAPVDGSC